MSSISVRDNTTAHANETRAWSLLRRLAERARRGSPVVEPTGLTIDDRGHLRETSEREAFIVARPDLETGWSAEAPIDRDAARLLDLYMPLCIGAGAECLTLAHLGQSADGHVAAFSGMNKFITGPADIEHTHRLRALFDAVLVGASTVAIDDPQLTTRLVVGKTPVRVVLDPGRRLPLHHIVFSDRAARTLVVVDAENERDMPAHVDVLPLPRSDRGDFDLAVLIERLRARGLRRVFIEGGGVTVARFLRAGLVDRLQLAVAPVVLGPGPTPRESALSVPALRELCTRVRSFRLGDDVLFDGELTRDTP